MRKGTRVKTKLGDGVTTGRKDLTRNGKDWVRVEVLLDEVPERFKNTGIEDFDKGLLWFSKLDIISKIK